MTYVAGALVATGSGSVVAKKRVEGRYYLTWFSSNTGSKQDYLFDPPSAGNLAALANTAWTAKTGVRNNARYVRQVKPPGVKVCPTLLCFWKCRH